MPTLKYGGRPFNITGLSQASNASSYYVGAWSYIPAAKGLIDPASERIVSCTITFGASLATAASTAAAGAAQVNMVQYNSSGSTVNSAILYNQVTTAATAFTPIDVTSLVNTWVLSAGDQLVIQNSANTAGVSAINGMWVSGNIDVQGS